MYRDLKGEDRNVLKGSRFVLLKGGERFDHTALTHIEKLEYLSWPLFRAYLLKEDLCRFWQFLDRNAAKKFLVAWIARALATHLKHLVHLAKSLRARRNGLLAYFDHRISAGPLEGVNNKIKVL